MNPHSFFQPYRMRNWLMRCFGKEILYDKEERLLRLLEETLELAQAEGIERKQAFGLVGQVFDKPVGDVDQELGGVMVCLSAYATVTHQDPFAAFAREFSRIEKPSIIKKIRAKWLTKAVVSSQSKRTHTTGIIPNSVITSWEK